MLYADSKLQFHSDGVSAYVSTYLFQCKFGQVSLDIAAHLYAVILALTFIHAQQNEVYQ